MMLDENSPQRAIANALCLLTDFNEDGSTLACDARQVFDSSFANRPNPLSVAVLSHVLSSLPAMPSNSDDPRTCTVNFLGVEVPRAAIVLAQPFCREVLQPAVGADGEPVTRRAVRTWLRRRFALLTH